MAFLGLYLRRRGAQGLKGKGRAKRSLKTDIYIKNGRI